MPAGRLRTRGQATLATYFDARGKERSAGTFRWADYKPAGSRGTGQRQAEEAARRAMAIKEAEVARGVAVDVDASKTPFELVAERWFKTRALGTPTT